MQTASWLDTHRCPRCRKILCRCAPGSIVEVKCTCNEITLISYPLRESQGVASWLPSPTRTTTRLS